MDVLLKDVVVERMISGATRPVLGPVSLSICSGEILSIVGASGSGKTTLLNMLASVEVCYSGTIDKGAGIEPVSYMLQDTPLLPWRTVRENVCLGAKIMRKVISPEKIDQIIFEVGLSKYCEAFPDALSGGMQRRAYLAQNLLCTPSLLLLDEPFTGLDYQTKKAMRALLKSYLCQTATVVMATHDIEDAILLSHRIVVLKGDPTAVHSEIDVKGIAEKDSNYLAKEREIFYIFEGSSNAESLQADQRAAK